MVVEARPGQARPGQAVKGFLLERIIMWRTYILQGVAGNERFVMDAAGCCCLSVCLSVPCFYYSLVIVAAGVPVVK